MKSGNKICWLHISDLHIRKDDVYNLDFVLSSLLEDIKALRDSSRLKPDFVCITGDLVYSGKDEEFALVSDFLTGLCKSSGVQTSKVFVVPGNHEIERCKITPLMSNITKILTSRDLISEVIGTPSDVEALTNKHSAFNEYVKANFPWAKDLLPSDLCFGINLITDQGCHVGLLGLNSVWTSSSNSNDDRGQLIVGERQVQMALERVERPCDLTIALLHHPISTYLNPVDLKDVHQLLRRECDFILTGHFHESDLFNMICPDSAACFICAGGAYISRKDTLSYNFVDVDLEKELIGVHFRKYADRAGGGHWIADNSLFTEAIDGQVMMPLMKNRILSIKDYVEDVQPGYRRV